MLNRIKLKTMKTPLKRLLIVIAAVLVATVAVFAQTELAGKLYKNEQEKKELVNAVMQDQELKAELRERMMKDKEGCSKMMAGNEDMMKMCSKMMAGMENHSSMCSMMMNKEEKPGQEKKADENETQLEEASKS